MAEVDEGYDACILNSQKRRQQQQQQKEGRA